jgi:hypothetical protein
MDAERERRQWRYIGILKRFALMIMKKKESYADGSQFMLDFYSLFGASPKICSILWQMILHKNNNGLQDGASPEHLLWALLFMKTYTTEPIMCSMVGVSRKTLRKWVWWVVDQLSNLEDKVVSRWIKCIKQSQDQLIFSRSHVSKD